MSEPFQVWICWVPQTAPRQTSWPWPRRWDRTRPPAPSPPPCPRAGTASSCRTRTGSRAPGAGRLRQNMFIFNMLVDKDELRYISIGLG